MNHRFLKIVGIISVIAWISSGCREDFDEYYKAPETSSMEMMDVISSIPEYSTFVNYLKQLKLDTIFGRNQSYTLFIPVNSAFEEENISTAELIRIMTYNITNTVILPSQVRDLKKIQTFSGKFSILERNGDELMRDGIPVYHKNPLYKNGTFYTLQSLLKPRPNLFEFLTDTCAILASYIEEKDSIAFDPVMSNPIGFDSQGNTIYDSVFNIVNTFERDYFPVSEESRFKTATLLIPSQEQYLGALGRMAERLGPPFIGYEDIPEDWQMDVFIPYLFENGTFLGAMQYEEFMFPLISNILGDSIRVDYTKIDGDSRFVCSNGITFLYNEFDVPEKLYIDTLTLEGEDLAVGTGNQFSWQDSVVTNNPLFNPQVVASTEALGGKYLSVPLPRGYSQKYYIEFVFPKVFPNNYRLLWRANYRPSGLISIYVNEVKVGAIDNYFFRNPVDGSRPTSQGFNQKVWSNVLVTDYGDLKIRFEYSAAGMGTSNGINIDYVALIPVN